MYSRAEPAVAATGGPCSTVALTRYLYGLCGTWGLLVVGQQIPMNG